MRHFQQVTATTAVLHCVYMTWFGIVVNMLGTSTKLFDLQPMDRMDPCVGIPSGTLLATQYNSAFYTKKVEKEYRSSTVALCD